MKDEEKENICPFCNGEITVEELTEQQMLEMDDRKAYVCMKHQKEILDLIANGKI